MKEDENVIFNDIFTEVPPPSFPGMKDSYCTNYCIRSGLCNAIFLAYNNDGYGHLQFDWCAVYKVDVKSLSIVALDGTTSVPVITTWNSRGGTPSSSKLITIGMCLHLGYKGFVKIA